MAKTTTETPAAVQATTEAAAVTTTPEQAEGTTVVPSAKVAETTTPVETVKVVASVAPEQYVLELPEGGRMDATDIALVETMARANGWDNARAQGVLEELDATLMEQSGQFLTETKADKTYGGDNLEESQRLAALVLDKVRPAGTKQGDKFRRLLDKGGYGNNLEVLSLLADLGKMMDEDRPGAPGPGGSVTKKDAVTALYGKQD